MNIKFTSALNYINRLYFTRNLKIYQLIETVY